MPFEPSNIPSKPEHAATVLSSVGDISRDKAREPDPVTLMTPVQFLPGVGPQKAILLNRLGVKRCADLLFLFPREYQEVAVWIPCGDVLADTRATVVGEIIEVEVRGTLDGRNVLAILISDGSGFVRGTWFNQAYRKKDMVRGRRVILTGIGKRTATLAEMIHPEIQYLEPEEAPPAAQPVPIYPLTEGLKPFQLRKMIATAIELTSNQVEEVLPEPIRESHALLGIQTAIKLVHQPTDMDAAAEARRRFIFQELYVFQLALAIRRHRAKHQRPAPSMPPSALIDARIKRRFPFELTEDQHSAMRDVGNDMSLTLPMNRLVQGDVGSGKTVIAQYAMLLAVAHGYQAALMAPTEVLARQHAQRLREALEVSRVRVELLVGSLTASQRRQTLESISSGQANVIVGTQSLLSESVEFQKLGVVIIDEQHKFGVQQRAALRDSQTQPHYLILTASPIPRTITMTLFGDLDVSILRQKPPGRAPVHTYLAANDQLPQWWQFVGKQIHAGRQAYVIAPRVELSDDDDLNSATALYQELKDGPFANVQVGLLHGRLSGSEKQIVIDQFNRGEIKLLVATTVVEVGIDVPNATVMTILDGDLLGLAQLHQLRGRISRGTHPGYLTVFASRGAKPEDNQRLSALAASSDGFELSELDMKLRGPGDLLGTRQHGLPPLRIADLVRDAAELIAAREAAQDLIGQDPELSDPAHEKLRTQVLTRYADRLDLGDVG